ncbi:Peroxidasin [Holothuria leucospilota]|uniref:Peroxidasin n=1 Tax=Holothuria leucospilota TaxID=206669 RepID=A0A9Q1HEQ7_HOLLE|nr:Peroxidasin [Holothuria leucospilota]
MKKMKANYCNFIELLLLAVLLNIVSASVIDSQTRCRYARRPMKVLAAFSSDEQSRHDRKRRELVEDITTLVHQIEEIHKSGDQNQATLAALREEYCDLVDFINVDVDCDNSNQYRTINGQCNNLDNPLWGRSGTPFLRLLPANYADGVSTPVAQTHTAREVSRRFVGNATTLDELLHSQLLVHLGQFLDHDIDIAPLIRVESDCTCEEETNCLPITCADDDPVCGEQECIPLTRSRPLLPLSVGCDGGTYQDLNRIQINGITSFIDASNVYGSTEETLNELRDTTGGMMKTIDGADPMNEEHIRLLPPDLENEECIVGANEEQCGKGGDIRAAETPGLTALHTLFVNEHNRIAQELAELNEDWDDERLFQETRKIVGALFQKIVYGEWLPLVIGKDLMEQKDLALWQSYKGYDDSVNPGIFTDFATAFFRFGHSLVPEELERVTPQYEDTHDNVPIRSSFFNAAIVHDLDNGGVNSLILGMLETRLLAVDRHISESVNLHLFEDVETSRRFGMDLISLNIQRGRDHGLSSYLDYREHCDLDVPTTFDGLRDSMDPDAVDAFEELYSSVTEIEPFVGMLAENHIPGALVGPTLGCILAVQFHNLKYGDRFWFENDEGPQAFTDDQLDAIRRVTMARIICDNVNVDEIRPAVFRLNETDNGLGNGRYYDIINKHAFPDSDGRYHQNFVNRRVKCDDYRAIPSLDLDAWSEDSDSSSGSSSSRSSGSRSSGSRSSGSRSSGSRSSGSRSSGSRSSGSRGSSRSGSSSRR